MDEPTTDMNALLRGVQPSTTPEPESTQEPKSKPVSSGNAGAGVRQPAQPPRTSMNDILRGRNTGIRKQGL